MVIAGVLAGLLRRAAPVDFLVYRYAGQGVLQGRDLYGGVIHGPMLPVEGLPFTYPPFAALALLPTTVGPLQVAYGLWSVGCIAIIAWTVHRIIPRALRHRTVLLVALTVAASATFVVTDHIRWGQVGLPLLALVLADLLREEGAPSTRYLPRGVLVGIAAAIKLTPALFIVYLLVSRQWRATAWSTASAILVTAVAWLILPGISWDFWTHVLFGLGSTAALSKSNFAGSSNQSLQGLLAFAGLSSPLVVLPVVAAAAALIVIAAASTDGRGGRVEAILITGLGASVLSPLSWIHHWVYLIPALLVILVRSPSPARAVVVAVAYVVMVVGPRGAELLLRQGPALGALGWAWRECLLLLGIACIIALTLDVRRNGRLGKPTRGAVQSRGGSDQDGRAGRVGAPPPADHAAALDRSAAPDGSRPDERRRARGPA